jgi:nucleoside-diphosphate-sugar epimerase
MKKVLITGITGLIGKHLMDKLLAEGGFQISGQYFSKRDISSFTELGVEMRQADICDASALEGICEGCEIVVHSAAKVIDWGAKEDFYEAHYDATTYMLDEALKSGVKHFIYISSFGPATYLDRSKALPDETVPLIKSGIHYDDAKVDTEQMLKVFCQKHKMAFSIVRPAAVIGPDSVWVKEPIQRSKTALGIKLVDGGLLDACLIDAENLADGLFRIITMEVSHGQTYFFMDDYGTNWKTYITDLLSIAGRKPSGNMPKAIALPAAALMEKLLPLLGKKPPISRKAVMATGSDRRVSTQKARRELGWSSKISYQDSMKRIEAWVKSQSWLME